MTNLATAYHGDIMAHRIGILVNKLTTTDVCIVYMPATGIVRITDTLQYILKSFAFPKTTTEDYLHQAIGDIIAIMKKKSKTLHFLFYGDTKKYNQSDFPHLAKKHISTTLTNFTITTNATTNSD